MPGAAMEEKQTNVGVDVFDAEEDKPDIKKAADTEPPDGGWGWMIVLAATLNSVLAIGFERSYSLIYLKLSHMFDVPAAELALIAGLHSGMRSFCGPIASALCNRFGHRETAVIGGAFSGIFMIMSAFPVSVPYLLVTRGLLCGFTQSLVATPIGIMPGLYFSKKKARANSIVSSGRGIGVIVFPFLIAKLLDEYGYQGTMLIIAALTFHHCALSGLYRPRKLTADRKQKDSSGDKQRHLQKKDAYTTSFEQKHLDESKTDHDPGLYIDQGSSNVTSESKTDHDANRIIDQGSGDVTSSAKNTTLCQSVCNRLRQVAEISGLNLLSNEILLAICLTFVTYTAFLSNTINFIANYATEELSISIYQVSMILTITGVVDSVSRIIGGCIFDLRCLRSWRPLLHAFCALTSGALHVLLTFLAKDLLSLTLLWILVTMLWGTFVAQVPTIIFDLVGPRKGTSAFGVVCLAGGIGFLAGSAAGGRLRDTYGSYKASFYMVGIALAASSLVYATIYILKKKKVPTATLR